MMLPKRKLGRSELEISAVGLGAWAIGGGDWEYGWGTQSDAESVAAIRHAVELGVNWIDTAPMYGLGHSEEVVGHALKEIGAEKRPFVFTKCGVIWEGAGPQVELRRILRPETLRREVEASLRRLRIERIDLCQIHHPPEAGSAPIEESWAEMAKLVDDGQVRAIGVSNFDIDLLERCEAVRHVDSLQVPFSLIRRESAEIIPWCVAHKTSVIVYSPMQSGLLTDRFSEERVQMLAEGDWRRRNRYFRSPQMERNLALRDALRPVAQRHGVSVAAIAVAWTLAWPGVTGALVGARSPEQVDGWIGASTLGLLSHADLDEIAQAIERTGAGGGPVRPPLPSSGEPHTRR